MYECRSALCFHVTFVVAAALRTASKNQALLCGQMRASVRDATASHFDRLFGIGTMRRDAVFALCAATSINLGHCHRQKWRHRRRVGRGLCNALRRLLSCHSLEVGQGSLTLSVLTNHAIVQVKAQSVPGLTKLVEKNSR